MAHKLNRIEKTHLFNKPHLITTESFQSIMDYIGTRPDGMMTKEELAVARDLQSAKRNKVLGENDVAVIPVSGVLTYEETMFGALCGMSSYQGILNMMEQAVKDKYKTVVLDVDSGGGEAYGVFELAKDMRRLADANNIKLVAYVDGMSASAAYGLSVAADEIIVNPYAEVGSIGVLTKLVNDSEKQKKEGIETTYIYAGDNKIPFNAEGEWREDFLEDIQKKVNTLYNDFVSNVAEMRGISEQSVRDTQASMFSASDAMELSLVDKIMERSEFANYLADISEEDDMPINLGLKKDKEETMSDKKDVKADLENPTAEMSQVDMKQFQEMQDQLAALNEQNQALKAKADQEAKDKIKESMSDLTFVDDVDTMASVLFGMKEEDRSAVMDAMDKAQASLEEAIATPMAVEGEAEPEEELDDVAKSKTNLTAKLQQKYSK